MNLTNTTWATSDTVDGVTSGTYSINFRTIPTIVAPVGKSYSTIRVEANTGIWFDNDMIYQYQEDEYVMRMVTIIGNVHIDGGDDTDNLSLFNMLINNFSFIREDGILLDNYGWKMPDVIEYVPSVQFGTPLIYYDGDLKTQYSRITFYRASGGRGILNYGNTTVWDSIDGWGRDWYKSVIITNASSTDLKIKNWILFFCEPISEFVVRDIFHKSNNKYNEFYMAGSQNTEIFYGSQLVSGKRLIRTPHNVTKAYEGTELTNGYEDLINVTMTGVDRGINAGTYTAVYHLDDGFKWTDGTTEDKTVVLTIAKAPSEFTVTPETATMNAPTVDRVVINYSGQSGNVHIVNPSQTGLVRTMYSTGKITVSNLNTSPVSETPLVWTLTDPGDANHESKTVTVTVNYSYQAQSPMSVDRTFIDVNPGGDIPFWGTYEWVNVSNAVGTVSVIEPGEPVFAFYDPQTHQVEIAVNSFEFPPWQNVLNVIVKDSGNETYAPKSITIQVKIFS